MSYEIQCKYCPTMVTRQQNVQGACCFSCKEKRNRKVAKEYAAKRRISLQKQKKLNIK